MIFVHPLEQHLSIYSISPIYDMHYLKENIRKINSYNVLLMHLTHIWSCAQISVQFR